MIGFKAFEECCTLTSIKIPNSVVSISDGAFYGCKNLMLIEVDENNLNYCDVDGLLFNKDKTTLIQYPVGQIRTSYIIPDSVIKIGDVSFAYYDSLTSITIPDSVTTIGVCAFDSCESLTSVTISDSVTNIGDYAFLSCTSLTSVTIPDSVTSIGEYAFGYYDDYHEYEVIDGFTIYGYKGSEAEKYAKDNKITFISLATSNVPLKPQEDPIEPEPDPEPIDPDYPIEPIQPKPIEPKPIEPEKPIEPQPKPEPIEPEKPTITVILSGTFGENLTWILYSNGELHISGNGEMPDFTDIAFSDWYGNINSVKVIVIGKDITKINIYAFLGAVNLEEIRVDADNKYYSSLDGVLFNKDKTLLISYPQKKSGNAYIIPESVTVIGDYAFSYNFELISITLPETLPTFDKLTLDTSKSVTLYKNNGEVYEKEVEIEVTPDQTPTEEVTSDTEISEEITEPPTEEQKEKNTDNEPIFLIVIIVLAVIIIALIVILIVVIAKKKSKK